MRRKPWSLILLALLHVISPIGSLLLNAALSGKTPLEQWYYWIEALPIAFPFIYIFLPILAGVFIYICRRWSYWGYLVCIGTIFISNIYSYYTNMTLGTLLILIIIALIDILVVAYFMVPSVQQVYFDPRMRWWEAAPRYNFNTSGIVNGGRSFIKNLSQGGMFITTGPLLEIGDKVNIFWEYKGVEQTISGIVVYKGTNTAEPGYGIRFTHTIETIKQLKDITDQLQAEGLIVKERLPGPEEGFWAWFGNLLKTGEGLFPKIKT